MSIRTLLFFVAYGALIVAAEARFALAQDPSQSSQKVTVGADGTVQIPGHSVPLSSFLSPGAKAYVTEHLKDMQDPELLKQDQGVPRFMRHYLERDAAIFPVNRKDGTVGGRAYLHAHASVGRI